MRSLFDFGDQETCTYSTKPIATGTISERWMLVWALTLSHWHPCVRFLMWSLFRMHHFKIPLETRQIYHVTHQDSDFFFTFLQILTKILIRLWNISYSDSHICRKNIKLCCKRDGLNCWIYSMTIYNCLPKYIKVAV